jgi:hypothetical protein
MVDWEGGGSAAPSFGSNKSPPSRSLFLIQKKKKTNYLSFYIAVLIKQSEKERLINNRDDYLIDSFNQSVINITIRESSSSSEIPARSAKVQGMGLTRVRR